MSKHSILAIVAGFIVILIIGGIFYSMLRSNLSAEQKLRAEQRALQNLNQAARQAASAPTLEIPSANPLDAALPKVNPVEAANPFKNVYQNPFE